MLVIADVMDDREVRSSVIAAMAFPTKRSKLDRIAAVALWGYRIEDRYQLYLS